MVTQKALTKPRVPDYSRVEPIPDPPRKPKMNEYPHISAFTSALDVWFNDEEGVVIASAGFLWRFPTDRYGPVPDTIFARGVRDPERVILRNGYVISEVGKPPDLVLEVGSPSTGRRDYTDKREIYAEYGAREYWRFDPSGGRHHDAPLAADILVNAKYQPMEITSESETRHWGYSPVLELEIWSYDGILRLRDPISGQFIPTHVEAWEAAQTARARAQSAEARAQSAESRAAQLEAQLRRLRGE